MQKQIEQYIENIKKDYVGFGRPQTKTQQEVHGTPESHVWEFYLANDGTRAYSLNKKSGEIREINKANYTILDQAKRQK